MKILPKTTTSVILSLSCLIAAPAFAEDGPTYAGLLNDASKGAIPMAAPAQKGGLTFKTEAVFVKPRFSEKNSAYVAQLEDEVAKNIEFDYDLEHSQRYELGYLAPTSKLGWRARTWYYDNSANAPFADDDNGLIADDAIAVAVGGATVEDIDTLAVSSHELEMWISDIEATYEHSPNLKLSAGLRIAKIDQGYMLSSDEGTLESDFDYLGFGPTVEVSYTKVVLDSAQYGEFSLYAKGRASAMWGKHEIDSTGDDGSYSNDETRFIYSLEASAGVMWRPQINGNENVYFTAGVEYQYWGNTGNAFNSYGDVTEDSPGSLPIDSGMEDGDISMFGFTIGVGMDF